jgi:CheY-like chemotaxis protein
MASRVMIVEDDAELQEFYALMLEDIGCQIIPAYDGGEALEKLAECVPDLMLLDILLDEMMGDVLFAEMRQQPRYADIPVVVASVLSRERCRGLLESDRRVVYLRKPFSKDELLDAVRSGLGRGAEGA